MTTTLQLSNELLADAERFAAQTGRTLEQVVEDSLRATLVRSNQKGTRQRVTLHTFGGGQINPGVDLSNNAALADLMDECDGFTGR